MSLPSMVPAEDVTGSIDRTAPALSSILDPEDWRRAMGALAVALDPQGNGAPARWDNPISGIKGVFTPVGAAFPSEDRVCRAFLTEIGGKTSERAMQGVGCRDRTGDWFVTDLKPWTKS